MHGAFFNKLKQVVISLKGRKLPIVEKKIVQYLKEIEEEKNVKILLACETGSRAWGFPSPDSDFDVRIIYVHKKDWYLSIDDKKDNIDTFHENNEIDISGWELRKTLRLLQKSNAPLLERIQSPIIYQRDNEFVEDYMNCAQQQYSRIATIHHYLNMAKGFLSDIEEKEEFKLKKFFYALRSASVSKWIAEKGKMPPIEFTKIYPNLNLDKEIVSQIDELIKFKKTKSEAYWHKGESELIAFIKDCNTQAENIAKSLSSGTGTIDSLNQLLQKYISKYDD